MGNIPSTMGTMAGDDLTAAGGQGSWAAGPVGQPT